MCVCAGGGGSAPELLDWLDTPIGGWVGCWVGSGGACKSAAAAAAGACWRCFAAAAGTARVCALLLLHQHPPSTPHSLTHSSIHPTHPLTHPPPQTVFVPSSFFVSNVFEGMIWFLLPCALVIINDIAAYLAGVCAGGRGGGTRKLGWMGGWGGVGGVGWGGGWG